VLNIYGRSKVSYRMNTQTHTHSRTTALSGPLIEVVGKNEENKRDDRL